jgi:predicted cupin superfamily sugar epimerase
MSGVPLTATAIIDMLGLRPHPEGGHFTETFRDAPGSDGRAASTAIYFLLARGERSHWHRVDASEAWHFYAGDPLTLEIAEIDSVRPREVVLGNDLEAGARPQFVVPAGHWQAAQTQGAWSLVGCTVAPGFEFSGFELAAPGWKPGG